MWFIYYLINEHGSVKVKEWKNTHRVCLSWRVQYRNKFLLNFLIRTPPTFCASVHSQHKLCLVSDCTSRKCVQQLLVKSIKVNGPEKIHCYRNRLTSEMSDTRHFQFSTFGKLVRCSYLQTNFVCNINIMSILCRFVLESDMHYSS